MEILSSLAVPGSAICAAIIGVVALARLRSTDREALSSSQRAYIEKLEEARDEADTRADKFRDDLDNERERRMQVEQDKILLSGQVVALNLQIQALQSNSGQSSHRNEMLQIPEVPELPDTPDSES